MGKKWDKVDAFESSPEKFPSSAIEFIILFVLMHCWIAWIILIVHPELEFVTPVTPGGSVKILPAV